MAARQRRECRGRSVGEVDRQDAAGIVAYGQRGVSGAGSGNRQPADISDTKQAEVGEQRHKEHRDLKETLKRAKSK